jgi:hypothetical protein
MHNALDMNGQGTIIKMFAAAGRGEELDSTLLAAEKLDADQIVPPLKVGETALSHDIMRKSSSLSATPASPAGPSEPAI